MISSTRARCRQATLITGFIGSGKTWALADKILQAAKVQDRVPATQPGSLLALVGADSQCSLQERVQLHRPLGCRKCDVLTFPALTQAIVSDFGPSLGNYDGDKRPLDRVELSVFLHRHLDELPLGKHKPLHNSGDAVRPLLELFSSLAHLGVEPHEYISYVDSLEFQLEHAAEERVLASQEQTEKTPSAERRARLEADAWREHVARERERSSAYATFQEVKQRERVVDFGDILLLARRILRGSTSARAELSLRLSHVFVDDLHDYSPAMIDVVRDLVTDGVAVTAAADPCLEAWSNSRGGRNAVGPDCSPIIHFKRAFRDVEEIHLAGSRWAGGAVVRTMASLEPVDKDASLKGIWSTEPRTGSHQAPTASIVTRGGHCNPPSQPEAGEQEEGGEKVTCVTFDSEDEEMGHLGDSIRGLVSRGVAPSEIAIVVLGKTKAESRLIAALSASGIRADGSSRLSKTLDYETPRLLMSLIRCLLYPSESTPLLHLLMNCPAYALPPGELAAALEGHMSRHVPLRSFLRELRLRGGNAVPDGSSGVSRGACEVASRLLASLDRLGELAKTTGVREVMLAFLRDTGQLEKLQDPGTPEEEEEGLAVARLFEVVAMAEKQAGGDRLAVVEPIVRLFRRHGMGYTSTPSRRAEDNGVGVIPKGSPDAVRIVRIDDAVGPCGRTYHTVFFPSCGRSSLPGPIKRARLPVPGRFRGAPEPRDTASIRAGESLSRVCHENRSRSALYAAVASARDEVHFSVAAGVTRGKKQLLLSPLLHDIFGDSVERAGGSRGPGCTPDGNAEARENEREGGTVAPDPAPAGISRGCRTPGARCGDANDTLEPLRLSFSSVHSYIGCPYSYYLQHVLHVTPPPSPRMVYGKAMHEAVAACLRRAEMTGEVSSRTLELALEEFHRHFVGCAFESASQVRALSSEGASGLESFVSRLSEPHREPAMADPTAESARSPARVLVERKFRVRVPEAQVILSGVFDRLDVVPGREGSLPARRVCITDYKSSVGPKNPESMVRESLQLRLYALAAERLFGVLPAEVVIESIEDGRRGVAVPGPDDFALALDAVTACASGVRAGRFDAAPSFQSCTFCGFKHVCRHSEATNATL